MFFNDSQVILHEGYLHLISRSTLISTFITRTNRIGEMVKPNVSRINHVTLRAPTEVHETVNEKTDVQPPIDTTHGTIAH